MMENKKVADVLAQGPFEKQLAQSYAFASDYYSIHHDSLENYLAATSGAASSNDSILNVTDLPDLLERTSHSWGGFMESMPKPCDTSSDPAAGYTTEHNPFVDYTDIVDNSTRCVQHVVNFTEWNAGVALGDLPNYSFIAPNLTHDTHSSSISIGDEWLRTWLSPLLNDSFFARTAVIITYDESAFSDHSGFDGTDGGHVYTVVVSPFSHLRYTSSRNYSTWDLLTTSEWLLGLGRTGRNDSWTLHPPMYDLFNFTPSSPGRYPITGKVVNTSGTPLGGATVSAQGAEGILNSSTGSDGAYSISLVNGTYILEAQASGYQNSSQQVSVSGKPIANVDFTLARRMPASSYSTLTGEVLSSATKLAVRGATVFINGSGVAQRLLTTASGTYTSSVPDGTFEVSANQIGFLPTFEFVTISGQNATAPPLYLEPQNENPSNGSSHKMGGLQSWWLFSHYPESLAIVLPAIAVAVAVVISVWRKLRLRPPHRRINDKERT
jgi:hypothetical protein